MEQNAVFSVVLFREHPLSGTLNYAWSSPFKWPMCFSHVRSAGWKRVRSTTGAISAGLSWASMLQGRETACGGPCQASGDRNSPPQCWFSCSVTQRTQKEQGESQWFYFTSKSQCLHKLSKLGATGKELPGHELAVHDPESHRTENKSCNHCLEPRGAGKGPRMLTAPDNACSTKTGNKMWIRRRWMCQGSRKNPQSRYTWKIMVWR